MVKKKKKKCAHTHTPTKIPLANAEDAGRRCRFDPWVKKIPWRRKCNPLQYPCWENLMDRGIWHAAVHGVRRLRHDLTNEHTTHTPSRQNNIPRPSWRCFLCWKDSKGVLWLKLKKNEKQRERKWKNEREVVGSNVLMVRSDQIRSVAQSCPTLCDPINHSTPDLPVHHQLPEFTQTHVH